MKRSKVKLSLILLVAFMFAFTLIAPGCGRGEDTFVVGFDAEFPPYGYKNDAGEYVGFDLSLAEEVCNRRGWTLVKQPIDWNSKDMELESGQIDCIWNGFTIDGREELYTWSTAYVDNSQVVIVKSDSDVRELTDLADKIVIVQKDSSALAAFTGEDAEEENIALCASFKELQQVADYNSAFMNLEIGAADAVCMDIGVAAYQLEARGNAFRMLDQRVSSEQYGIGFRLGNVELRDQVQETLEEMNNDGTLAKIAEEWGLSDSLCFGKEGTDEAYLLSSTLKAKVPFGQKIANIMKQLSKGMLSSLLIFVLTLLFAMPLGLLVMFVRRSKIKIFEWIAKIYISIMRGTPLMLQLMVVFYGPYFVFGINTSSEFRFYAVIIGFSLNYAAYFAEIYRAGIESIDVGQYEAATVLGYTHGQTFRKIILPQMVKRVIPPVTNEIITLIKDTSLAFVLAYTEMFTIAEQVMSAEASMLPLIIAGIVYYVFNFIVAMVMERIEKNLSYYN